MVTLALVGFLGGLITGVSPCILPVLPVIFFSGADHGSPGRRQHAPNDADTSVITKTTLAQRFRPYWVIGGLVLSFSAVTLVGSALLSLLHLPQDAVRWAALVALVAIGLGLIFPQFEQLLEKPFARLPQKHSRNYGNGFALGLALGILYVPCAGPILAAIIVAGATAKIGTGTVVLTCAFALGAALPLLLFALAGQQVAQRVSAFRRRQRRLRIAAGIVTILLAVALVFNLPALLQQAIPDYTSSLQDKIASDHRVQEKLNLGGIVNDENAQLSHCTDGGTQLESCGPAPSLKGIVGWLNTPGDRPIDLKALRGKVVLIDFWAYSCINCQRAIPHVVNWFKAYHDNLEVIGVHTPEYAFEKEPANVAKGAADLGITYPIALDNGYSTWTNYRNRYWPAEYLIDATGTVRHIKFGEGGYSNTEKLIRQLITDADPGVRLPPPRGAGQDNPPPQNTTPETYFGVGKVVNYRGTGQYDEGATVFDYPPHLPPDSFALRGPWSLDYQGATANSDESSIELNYHAKNVYLVAGGTGTVTVTRGGQSKAIAITGPPTSHLLVADDHTETATLQVQLTKGLQAFSFTYG